MSLLFCDSFDHYATADITSKWTVNAGGIIASGGRNSTNCVRLLGNPANLTRTFPGSGYNTIIVGAAFKFGTGIALTPIIQLGDATVIHVDVRCDGSKCLTVTRAGTLLEIASFTVVIDTWYYIELKVKIGDTTTGTWELRVNGVTVAQDVGGGDTQNGGTAFVNKVVIGGVQGNELTVVDDLYICDTTGTYNNDFLGDVRVYYSPPDANGTNVAWAASAGTDEECVDETAPNSDTDYISTATPADKESFAFAALGITGNVKAVQTSLFARKDDAGSRTIRELCRSGGTNYVGASASIGDTYLYYCEIREINPDGAPAAWSVAGVDAAEFGVELVS